MDIRHWRREVVAIPDYTLTPLVRGEREDGERKREVAERGFWTAHARGTRSLKGSCGERRM